MKKICMEKLNIKKESEEDSTGSESRMFLPETSRVGGGSFPPTQRVSPTSTPLRTPHLAPALVDSTMSISPPGVSDIFSSHRTVKQIKRFLSTLIKFGTDMSTSVGDKVRDLVFNLVSGLLTVSEFHRQLQEVTNFPVRPYVLPFLHTNIPFLQREIAGSAAGANKTVLEYLRLHEQTIFTPAAHDHNLAEASEIFHSEAVESHGIRKRRTSSNSDGESASKRAKPGLGLISPPIFTSSGVGGPFTRKDVFSQKWNAYPGKLAIVPGCPSSGAGSAVGESNAGAKPETNNTDDEWKNVQVMLNCILGMVDKTQRAINILQQRQTTANHFRSTEDIIEEVQASAVRAVNEVKQNALSEIARARNELMLLRRPGREKEGLLRVSTTQSDGAEICWNCGRSASETCSGCKVAKYCGAFCQHKDWESHHRVCRVTEDMSSHSLDLNSNNNKPDTSKEVK